MLNLNSKERQANHGMMCAKGSIALRILASRARNNGDSASESTYLAQALGAERAVKRAAITLMKDKTPLLA